MQLYNQLRAEGRPPEELALVKRAYDFLATMYPGYYQADGKPFPAHGVGVASAVAHLGVPAEFVATALLHNIYGNGDFGDGRASAVTRKRRRLVQDAIGERIESLVIRFRDCRVSPETIERIEGSLDDLDADERNLVLIDLADHLEKYVDLGVLYFGDNLWMTERTEQYGKNLVTIARRLDQEKLADLLERSFEEVALASPDFPEFLKSPPDRRYLALFVPRSCRRRFLPWVRHVSQAARNKARLRTRLRDRQKRRTDSNQA